MPPPQEILVTLPEQLVACCAALTACRTFGLDTEFVGEESYHPKLCLIQAATPDALYLIDPFTVGPLDAFWQVLVDPANLVIVHAGREEVRLCHLWCGQVPGRLFDLQIAAGLAGFAYPLGHGPLVNQVLGVQLAKGETLTEWRTRPLTREQLQYAFDDVRYLLRLWDNLHQRLEGLQRTTWAEEEFARLSQQATPDEPGLAPGTDRWRKLRGAGSLDRRRLAMLRELFLWREQQAAQANRPARTLVRDDLLVEVARRNPSRERDLHVVRGLAKRYAADILEALERARKIPVEDCPPPAERDLDPPQVGLVVNVLAAVLADFAVRHRLAANLVATTQDLKNLVRSRMQGKPPPAMQLTQGWRATHVLPELEAILDGKRGLRVADLHAEAPFAFENLSPLPFGERGRG